MITPPKDPDDKGTKIEMFLWQEKEKQYMQKQEQLKDNLKKVYDMVPGQYNPTMRANVKEVDDFENIPQHMSQSNYSS